MPVSTLLSRCDCLVFILISVFEAKSALGLTKQRVTSSLIDCSTINN